MQESHVVVSSSQSVTLVDATNGALHWQYGPIDASSRCVVVKGDTVTDSRIYVGDRDGMIHQISFATGTRLGELIWVGGLVSGKPYKDDILGPPVRGLTYQDGVLYVTAGDSLRAVDPAASPGPFAGPLWTFGMDDSAWGDPVVAEGMVYAGSYDRTLYGMTVEGIEPWTSTAFSYFGAEPTVVDGVVYVPGYRDDDQYVVALDATSGTVLWHAQSPDNESVMDPVAVGDGRVYAGTWGDGWAPSMPRPGQRCGASSPPRIWVRRRTGPAASTSPAGSFRRTVT